MKLSASEIAWKAVVEHPLSGVTDKNRNGIADHLEGRISVSGWVSIPGVWE